MKYTEATDSLTLFYAPLSIITSRSDVCNALGLLKLTSSSYSKLRQVCYNVRQLVVTNYGRFVMNHKKIYYMLLQSKYFINYSTFRSYYKLRQKVVTNYNGYYKLRLYYKLRRNMSGIYPSNFDVR